jgi:hypothetical protein
MRKPPHINYCLRCNTLNIDPRAKIRHVIELLILFAVGIADPPWTVTWRDYRGHGRAAQMWA